MEQTLHLFQLVINLTWPLHGCNQSLKILKAVCLRLKLLEVDNAIMISVETGEDFEEEPLAVHHLARSLADFLKLCPGEVSDARWDIFNGDEVVVVHIKIAKVSLTRT